MKEQGQEEQMYIKIKPYLLRELAALYEVDPKTFGRWLKPFKAELGERIGRYYSIPQVKVIFSKLDVPGKLIVEGNKGN